ncbi:cysteine hydrolase family protein [Frateuria aurantia]
MPLTTLDPTSALLIVDLQQGLLDSPFIHPFDTIIQNAVRLVDAFRHRGLPVVLINVDGRAPGRTQQPAHHNRQLPPDFARLLPELRQQPDDLRITKKTWGAFANTDLGERLKAMGVTQVVLAGVATGTGVDSTARQAFELGFNVTLAVDAMTDTRPEAHDYSIHRVFPRLGETGSTQAVLDLLQGVPTR